MWACTSCHKPLSRKITTCPKCGGKANFICKDCHKDLPDGKHTYCGFHLQKHKEERKEKLKKAGETVAALGGTAIVVVTTPIKEVVKNPEKIKNLATNMGKIVHK